MAGENTSATPFGTVFTPNMMRATYEDGAWSKFRIVPLENYSLHPASLVLHYSQTIFEGLKAYRHADDTISLFRPGNNAARLNRSAQRMAIPAIDEAAFLEALVEFVRTEREHVPARPGSLYLRPTIFASEVGIRVHASNRFEFFVIAAPVGSYFASQSGEPEDVEIFVSERVARAAPGGTGAVKAGANYGVTLQVIGDAQRLGSQQVLFLDSGGKRFLEEAGGMNVFAVRDKQLITPPLSGTILPGVTRDSILAIAPSFGLTVKEEALSLDLLLSDLKDGVIREVFLSGTAAVIVSVDKLRFEDGGLVDVGKKTETPVANLLRDRLMGIQFGLYEDPFDWLVRIPR